MGYPYLWARGIARERLGLLEALWASFAGVANDRVLVARPLASPIFSATVGGLFSPAFKSGLLFFVPIGLMFGPLINSVLSSTELIRGHVIGAGTRSS